MDKVTREVAAADVDTWLTAKKVSDKKREDQKDQIESLTDYVAEGLLVLKPSDNSWVQTLKFPIGEEVVTKTFEYIPRLNVKKVQANMTGVKAADADARITAYIAALTGNPKNLVLAMDTEDYNVAQTIAIFFL